MVRFKDQLAKAKGKPSAFESAPISKKRHNVLGDRNRNGKARSQVQARSRSDQIRRETLLVEHKQRGRTNTFVDGRFGEEDDNMPQEDKLIYRFQRERQRQIRQSKYSLGDEAVSTGSLGRPTELTHGGQALGDMDDLSDADLGFSDDEGPRGRAGGFEGADFVKRAHFGGGDAGEGDERQLSGKELLEQTIAKYKMAKYERQEERSEQNKQLQQLDADFDAIRGLVFAAGKQKLNHPSGTSTLDAERSAVATARNGSTGGAGPAAHSDYERLASELKTERKARPSDRLQTDAELATAEAERLRHLEHERLRRMNPDGKGGAGEPRRMTDDDLLDDFGPLPGDFPDDDDEQGDGMESAEDEESDEDEEEEDESDEEEDDGDGQGEEGDGGETEDGEDEEDEEVVITKSSKAHQSASKAEKKAALTAVAAVGATTSSSSAEMPYVFQCPTTMAELDKLMTVAGPDAGRQKELLHRLIAGHNVRLKEANKSKLHTLVALLIDRLLNLAEEAACATNSTSSAGDGASELMHVLPPAIFSIAQQQPVQSAMAIIDRIHKAWTTWRNSRREAVAASKEDRSLSRHASLEPKSLALVALCVQLYPLTDFRHVVLTPCLLFAAEVLAQKETPSSGMELRRTLFLTSCSVHFMTAAGRWLPELQTSAHELLANALSNTLVMASKNPKGVKEIRPLTFDSLGRPDESMKESEAAALLIDAAAATYRLMRDLVCSAASLAAFVESFAPTLKLLAHVDTKKLCPVLRPEHEVCIDELRSALVGSAAARAPLRLQRAAPVPLRQFNPAFDDDFQPDQSMDPDRERAERQKLARKTKKEKKGAIRELRKDAAFLAVEKEKEVLQRDEYLEKRGKRALALLEQQEHDVKSMKKEKRKLGRGGF